MTYSGPRTRTLAGRFRRSAAQAVAARSFTAIITDGPGVPLGYPSSLGRYYRLCPQPLLSGVPGGLFRPVAGASRRPEFVWLPRAAAGRVTKPLACWTVP